jgi:hypothetical protein
VALTITTRPQHKNLVDRAWLRRELSVGEEADPLLDDLERAATGVAERFCQREFGRGVFSETVPGYGGVTLMLSRTPVVAVTSVVHDGAIIADYVIDNPDVGTLYRALGWQWSAGTGWYLDSYIVPRSEEPVFTVVYTAGYLMPEDDVASKDLSVDASDKSFNLPVGQTFPLLVAGDVIESSGFGTAANNATWTVVSRTAQKVIVAESGLSTEAAAANPRALRVRTLPDDVTKAAIDICKGLYISRQRDPMVASRSITGLSVTYAAAMAGGRALPPMAQALLAPWQRVA